MDDEPELLEIFAIWLRRSGGTVLTAANGAEALKILDRVSEEMRRERDKLVLPLDKAPLDEVASDHIIQAVRPTKPRKSRRVLKHPRILRAKRT